MNVLVTGVGGPTPRSFVRAVKLSQHPDLSGCRFVGVDCNRLAYGLYENELFDQSYVVPPASANNYWEQLHAIIDREQIDAAIVLPELEVLEWSKQIDTLPASLKVHLPEFRLADLLVDKYRLHQALAETDSVPRFAVVDPSNFDYAAVADLLGPKFWIRGTIGSSGLGSLLIDHELTLKNWISINPDVEQFIASQYLPGRNLACKLLYFDDQLVRTACAERVYYIMSKVAPSGITGNTSFGRLLNEPFLVSAAEKIMRLIANSIDCRLNGIFTIDFKEDEQGIPKVTEINVRHVAFTHAMAAGGANLPADTLLGMFDPAAVNSRIDYRYPPGLIFLRDVDGQPIIMNEAELLG